MSECVVRMEIPENCLKCPLRNQCEIFCDWFWHVVGRAARKPYPKPFDKGCWIVCQLPEGHGRLVDADANFLGVIHLSSGGFVNYNTTIAERLGEEDMRSVKVIVPAEK